MPITYLFEVRQIQAFVFATNKLRDATGASELINLIASDDGEAAPIGIAAEVWQSVGMTPEIHRATGGVVEISCDDDALFSNMAHFRAAFRLRLAVELPGLTYSDGIGRGATQSDSRKDARAAAASGLVSSEVWPMLGPMTRPAPRSGGIPAVVSKLTRGMKCVVTGEFADLPTLMKRDHSKKNVVAEKFIAPSPGKTYSWPVTFPGDIEADGDARKVFPFDGAHLRRVALLHADGNGMGAVFQRAVQDLPKEKDIRKLSRAIAQATRGAVHQAMAATALTAVSKDGVVPCRPILLGGDDLTLILRADLALAFARLFLCAFEANTLAVMADFFGDPKGLSAKVGIVFLSPNQPFGSAHRLCEDLAKTAKHESKSQIAYWRLTSSAIPHSESEIAATTVGATGISLRKQAHDLQSLAKVEALAELLKHDDVGAGALRQVPELLKSDRDAAVRVYQSAMAALMRRSAGKTGDDDIYSKMLAALKPFCLDEHSPDNGTYSPLWEAHELGQIGKLATAKGPAGDEI